MEAGEGEGAAAAAAVVEVAVVAVAEELLVAAVVEVPAVTEAGAVAAVAEEEAVVGQVEEVAGAEAAGCSAATKDFFRGRHLLLSSQFVFLLYFCFQIINMEVGTSLDKKGNKVGFVLLNTDLILLTSVNFAYT